MFAWQVILKGHIENPVLSLSVGYKIPYAI